MQSIRQIVNESPGAIAGAHAWDSIDGHCGCAVCALRLKQRYDRAAAYLATKSPRSLIVASVREPAVWALCLLWAAAMWIGLCLL